MGTSDLYNRIKVLLQSRHPNLRSRGAEWIVLFELRDGTGWSSRGQRMDAFAMHTWPSRKFHRVGYEIKLSRGDFLGELKQFDKRDWAMSITNEFWFVAPPKIIDVAELPEGCGLLIVTMDGDGLKTARAAAQRKVDGLKMPQIASILRKAAPQTAFDSVRWLLAGRELTDEDLTKILEAEQDRLARDQINTRVREQVKAKLETTTESLLNYAEALNDAGVPPPAWMLKGWPDWKDYHWDAVKWVKDHVTTGPGGASVLRAQAHVQSAQNNLIDARNALLDAIPKRKTKPRPV